VIRAAQITAEGRPPELVELDGPVGDGDMIVDVSAFALNPIDVNVALGRFYGGMPPLPYVVGVEAVGRDESGRRVYLNGPGIGIARDGVWAEQVAVPSVAVHELPSDVSDEVALACGTSGLAGWVPVTWRARVRPADRVLVLGATGSVGRIAVQAAKLCGASRIVAVGRRREALELARGLGADAILELEDGDLVERIQACFGGDGPTVVIDPLWGAPAAAALTAGAPGVRLVQVGQSAGAEASIASNSVRGKQAEIYGYSNYRIPPDVFESSYRELVEHAAAGRVKLDPIETYPFERLHEAWDREAAGPGAKLVVRFEDAA
jgi:NADPH2:quinone reductase